MPRWSFQCETRLAISLVDLRLKDQKPGLRLKGHRFLSSQEQRSAAVILFTLGCRALTFACCGLVQPECLNTVLSRGGGGLGTRSMRDATLIKPSKVTFLIFFE